MMSLESSMEPVAHRCRVCDAERMYRFLSFDRAPAHIGVLWRDRASAVDCPKGDVVLCFCKRCGFVYNVSFDPVNMTYEEGYDNALDFSPTFQEYAGAIADELVERYELRSKHVIEIGCGNGEFLKQLCERGANHGTGFDPSAPPEPISGSVDFVQDYYGPKYARYPVDLITCRHVFEHVEDPAGFLVELRETLGDRDVALFFEVPNLHNIVAGNSPWEIIYEHCSYFGSEAMTTVFTAAGFRVEETRPLFRDLYLGIFARSGGHPEPARPDESAAARTGVSVERFSSLFEQRVREWRGRLESLQSDGRKVVVWGAGARGTTFVNLLDAADSIGYLVDINPRKHGKHVPGTGHEIIPPGRLRDVAPDVVIVMNPVYMQEIQTSVSDMGLSPRFLAA